MQSGLRWVLETQSPTTRFFLISKHVTRIIEPISSRCSEFRIKASAADGSGTRLRAIAAAEGAKYDDGIIERLLDVWEGDLRRRVSYLQSSFNLISAAATAQLKGKRGKEVVDSDSDEK